ncbi:MAG: hypothetical protein RL180_408 [Pseudomonadota bacterium]|jgi:tellurite resistance protein TerA
MQLTIGANTTIPTDQLELQIHANTACVVDIAAYALSELTQQVRGDQDMIFYGQLRHASGAIELQQQNAQHSRFILNLPHVDPALGKIAFTATLEQPNTTFNSVNHIELTLLHRGQTIASATLSGQGRSEAALILAECYRRQGAWKFRIIGQGFNGGLKPLSEHFGVDIADTPAPAAPLPPVTPPATPKVSLSKVSLDKNNRRVSLEKTGSDFGEIRVNLNWNTTGTAPAKSGFFAKLMQPQHTVDLDLGCLYELQNGERALVQALGKRFGDFHQPPYIQLSGDDRTGAVKDGEWMRINGQHWSKIKRIMIYAFIYQGVPNWAATDGVITIHVPNQAPIEIALTEGDASKSLCAVVMLENRGGQIDVSREVRYFASQKPLDEYYGWGLRWTTGSKD